MSGTHSIGESMMETLTRVVCFGQIFKNGVIAVPKFNFEKRLQTGSTTSIHHPKPRAFEIRYEVQQKKLVRYKEVFPHEFIKKQAQADVEV